jgi:hypothetical protein
MVLLAKLNNDYNSKESEFWQTKKCYRLYITKYNGQNITLNMSLLTINQSFLGNV